MSKLTKEQIATAKQLLKEHNQKAVHVIIDGVHMYFDKNNALQGVKDESEIETVFASDEAKAEYESEQKKAEKPKKENASKAANAKKETDGGDKGAEGKTDSKDAATGEQK